MVGTANGESGAHVLRLVEEAHRQGNASVINQNRNQAGKNAMYLDQARKSKNVAHKVALVSMKSFFFRH